MSALRYTLDQVRDRELSHLGVVGTPNPWWPLDYGNGCLAFQLYCLGVRSRQQLEPRFISIGEFLDQTTWDRISPAAVRPGDLVLQDWEGNRNPDHIEMTYSRVSATTITTIGANTGPAPGVSEPKGAWKKTRPVDSWLIGGIRPPYADATRSVPPKRRARVRLIAEYLNKHLDGPNSEAAVDGFSGPKYWTLVQTWGRAHGIYPLKYVIDGVPGPQTLKVEAEVWQRATKR